jgi:hypothetical protein
VSIFKELYTSSAGSLSPAADFETLAHFNGYFCDYGLLLTLNHQEAAGCTLYRNARAFADGIYMKRWRILMEICVYYILCLIAAC